MISNWHSGLNERGKNMDNKTLKDSVLEKFNGGTNEFDEQILNVQIANNERRPFIGDAAPTAADIISELKS